MGKTAKTPAPAETAAAAEARTITLADADFWKFDAMCSARQLAEERATIAVQQVQLLRTQLTVAVAEQTNVLAAIAEQHAFTYDGCSVALDRATRSIILTPVPPDAAA